MRIRAFAIAAAVAALVPVITLAQPFGPGGGRGPGGGGGTPPCMAADTDGDGVVSADELATFRAERRAQRPMLRADTNGNGVVTAEERAAFQGQGQRRGGMPCPWANGAAGAGPGAATAPDSGGAGQ